MVKRYKQLIVLGDLNVRLQARRCGEKDVISNFVFGRGEKCFEEKTNGIAIPNRDLLITMAWENKLVVHNTRFEKSDDKLISYKVTGTTHLEDIDPRHFATTDHILGLRWQKHLFENVETDTKRVFPSDHFPMIAEVTIKPINEGRTKPESRKQYLSSTEEEKERVNRNVKEYMCWEEAQNIVAEGETEMGTSMFMAVPKNNEPDQEAQQNTQIGNVEQL